MAPQLAQLSDIPLTLGGTPVEASINRPGMNHCPIELDLRADVSGSIKRITNLEAPVIAFATVSVMRLVEAERLIALPPPVPATMAPAAARLSVPALIVVAPV